jgi:hypothetical protein
MNSARQYARAVLLTDGRVMVVGGGSTLGTAEIYDPVGNTWTNTASMPTPRFQFVAERLPDGRVLVAGGGYGGLVYNVAEIYDPTTDAWSSTGNMTYPREYATSVTLGDGTILLAGGSSGTAYINWTDRYDPTSGTWADPGSLANGREFHTMTLLADGGRALVVGGANTYLTASAELFSLLGQNGATCSANSDCGSGYCVDGVCCNTACGGGSTTDCQACSVAAGAAQDGVCGALTTGTCAPTCITIQRGTSGTVADTHVVSTSASTNYGTNAILSTGGISGSTRYGLLRFDLSAIPSTAVITQATLTLNAFSGGGATERVHRITASWAESTATWSSFASAFDATVAQSMTATSTYSGDVSTLVQSWVNGTYANYGFLLERDLSAATGLYASEYTTASLRPKLYVCYTH